MIIIIVNIEFITGSKRMSIRKKNFKKMEDAFVPS